MLKNKPKYGCGQKRHASWQATAAIKYTINVRNYFFYQVNSYIGALYLNQNNFRNQTIVVLFWDRFFFSFAKNQLEKEPK